jgi:hypothetical protein
MRLQILSLFVIGAVLLGEIQTASAQSPTSYPWCARYYKEGTPTSCYFTSYEQCRASVSGIGGLCFQSPYYHATPASVPPRALLIDVSTNAHSDRKRAWRVEGR